jgi:hypothetical protein
MLDCLLFMQKKWLSFLQTDRSLARFVITTGRQPKNLAAARKVVASVSSGSGPE